jgi:L-alanine-DL-glutamate epimerase-like enolase superfamily enzyme
MRPAGDDGRPHPHHRAVRDCRDATDIPGLMGELWFRTKACSRNGPVAFALSGLDIALWDIKGKVAARRSWRLLGGAGKAAR